MWYHPCLGTGTLTSSTTCPDCGAQGTFVGWFRKMHEGMALYQYLYGLMPIGPHRPMADRLFGSGRRACDRCDGEGLLTVDESSWLMCFQCEGSGGFWTISEEAVQEIRARILSEFPDAGSVSAPTSFLSGPFTRNLRTGESPDAREGREEDPDALSPRGSESDEAESGSPHPAPYGATTDLTLVYAVISPGDSLVFATLERARDVSQMYDALNQSRTWGEFRRRLPAAAWEQFGEAFEETTDGHGDDAPFSPGDLCMYCEGDFPPWLQAEQAAVLPPEILEAYGTRQESVLNGSFWVLDPAREDEVVAALRALGYEVQDSAAAGGLTFW